MVLGLTVLGVCSLASPAHAGFTLGLDLGPNFVLNDGIGDVSVNESAGIGFAGRVGYMVDAKLLRLTPELKVGFEDPGTPDAFRILGGLRVNVLQGLSPVAFAHLGGLVGDLQGFAWDVGGGVDLTIIPKVDLGIFVSYNRAEDSPLEQVADLTGEDPAWEWIQVGAQATLHF